MGAGESQPQLGVASATSFRMTACPMCRGLRRYGDDGIDKLIMQATLPAGGQLNIKGHISAPKSSQLQKTRQHQVICLGQDSITTRVHSTLGEQEDSTTSKWSNCLRVAIRRFFSLLDAGIAITRRNRGKLTPS